MKISTLVQLGAIKFSPKKGDEPGHVVIEYILAGEDQVALLPSLVELQQGTCNLSLSAGRAGTWTGLVYFRAATIKPPDKKRNTTIVGTVACFMELEKLQDLARLRIAATEFDSDLATLTAELVQPGLPLEFGKAASDVVLDGLQDLADKVGADVSVSDGVGPPLKATPRGRRKKAS